MTDTTDAREVAETAAYRALCTAMDQGFCVVEVLVDDAGRPADYRFLEVNPAFAAQTGLADAVGRTARELVPGLEQHWVDAYGRVALTCQATRFSQGSDAMGRRFDVHAFPVGDAAGRRVGILFTDVTAAHAARRESAAALAAADLESRRLAAVLEQLPVGVYVAEAPSGRLLLNNAAVRRIWGADAPSAEIADYSRDYVGYHPAGTPRAGQRYESHEWPLARALKRGEVVADERIEVPRGDARATLSVSAAPVRDAEGRIVGGVVTSIDVTERERLLAETEAARAELEAANAQLQEHGVEAERSNQQLQDQAAELEATAEELQAAAAHLEEQVEAADRARREAEAERARLDQVVTQFPAAVAVFEGPELRFRAVSEAYRRIVGGRDVVGRPIREALPELTGGAGGPDFFALLDGVRRTGEPVVGTAVPASWDDNGDGVPEDHAVDLVYAPLRGAPAPAAAGTPDGTPGPVDGVVALVLDVSARARAEAAVRESETRFRQMADAAPVMLWVTEPDGTCTFLNRAWLDFTGQTLEEGLGLGWLDAVHPDDAADAERVFLDATARAAPFRLEYRLRRADGQYRRAIDAAAPRLGPGGEFLGYVGSVVDIEERARLLDAEQAARAGAEAARADADTARRAAEAANAAKSQFLANMSHELRTPLNAISGYVQLLEMGVHGPVTAEQQGALGRVQKAQTRLLTLINDILNYAKLEGGRVEYDVQAVDVRDVVAEVGPLVEPQMTTKGLAFAVRLPDTPCVVWADREKLGQVLVNLLSNATKFTDARHPVTRTPGRVVVDLAVRTEGADGGQPGHVYLRVTDTGHGVPRDKQEAIFEPFVQVRSGYANATEGTGLGLAISRDLARGMGGDLRVRSAPGEGATFTVTLRRVVDAEGQPTDRRALDERREAQRRGDDDRRHDAVGHDAVGHDAVGEPAGATPDADQVTPHGGND